MRYLSLFSGIEAASAAWQPLGWECVAVSEIEAFPCSALAHHHPDVPNLGDVTRINEYMIAGLGRIDLVVFGSPCQDLSIAGNRAGLQGERSGLFHTALRIIQWARTYCGTRYALWENVPGAFSSNRGADFGTVVGALGGSPCAIPPNGWGNEGIFEGAEALVEWSTLDAQWFGVAQRRRRVFALADFGNWRGRPPVLLEPESLRGDFAPRRQSGQSVAGTLESRPSGGGFPGTDGAAAGHVVASTAHCPRVEAMGRNDYETETFVAQVAGCLNSVGGHAVPGNSVQDADQGYLQVVHSLRADGFDASEDGTGRGTPIGTIGVFAIQGAATRENPKTGPDGIGVRTDDVSYTLEARSEVQAVAFESRYARNGRGVPDVVVPPLKAQSGETGKGDGAPLCQYGMQVRRLTPTECERLQGFPDGHTAVLHRGKPAADGPRYKALGNSMAVPVMRWIGQQLDRAATIETML